jgi:DNA-binding HxlR family transcriptional regulator
MPQYLGIFAVFASVLRLAGSSTTPRIRYKFVIWIWRHPEAVQEGTSMTPGRARVLDSFEDHFPDNCQGVTAVLSRVGDKWSVLIVAMLGSQPRRFNELKRMIGGITQRMLTRTLRGLERDGLVTRTMFPTIPPRVEYALTPLGSSLWKPVRALGIWAQANQAEIAAARENYDRRPRRARD